MMLPASDSVVRPSQGSFSDSIAVLDTGTFEWTDHTVAAKQLSGGGGAGHGHGHSEAPATPAPAATGGGGAASGGAKSLGGGAGTIGGGGRGLGLRPTGLGTPDADAPALPLGPRPRADAQLAYDPGAKRVLLLGGFANRWFGDVWSLAAASIIGPPYAILGLRPHHGPITGGQELFIDGMCFEAGASAAVRFISGKKFVEAIGTCVDEETVTVATPPLDAVR